MLAHEAIGHLAVEELLDQADYSRAIKNVQVLERMGNKTLRELGKTVDERQPGLKPDTRAKEIMAMAVENGTYKNIPVLQQRVAAIAAWVKAKLRAMGFDFKWVGSLSEGEIFGMLRQAERRLEGETQERSEGMGAAEAVLASKLPMKNKATRDAQGRLLAPNGKPSKLNERQWHQVRSPEFKAWFGNWRYDPAMPVKITKISGNEIGVGQLSSSRIKEWMLREQRWQDMPPVINADTGNAIGFTVQGVKDSLKRKSDEQRKAYAGLRSLIEDALFVDFEPVREGKANEEHLQGYEVYYGALDIDGTLYGVKLKVELPKGGANRDRAYKDHKIVDVEVRSPVASLGSDASAPGVGDPGAGPTQTGGSTVSLGQLVGKNKPTASKVVDDNGEPLVVYHSTETSWNTFDTGKASGSAVFGKGI